MCYLFFLGINHWRSNNEFPYDSSIALQWIIPMHFLLRDTQIIYSRSFNHFMDVVAFFFFPFIVIISKFIPSAIITWLIVRYFSVQDMKDTKEWSNVDTPFLMKISRHSHSNRSISVPLQKSNRQLDVLQFIYTHVHRAFLLFFEITTWSLFFFPSEVIGYLTNFGKLVITLHWYFRDI